MEPCLPEQVKHQPGLHWRGSCSNNRGGILRPQAETGNAQGTLRFIVITLSLINPLKAVYCLHYAAAVVTDSVIDISEYNNARPDRQPEMTRVTGG